MASNPIEMTVAVEKVRDVERLRSGTTVAGAVLEGLWDEMYDDRSPAFLMIGYGANRRVESASTFDSSLRGKQRLLRYQRVASLFEEQVTLVPLAHWLPDLGKRDPGRHKQVCGLVNRLLPPGMRFTARTGQDDYLFSHKGVAVPFGALSDGHRAYVGWVADLLHHVCTGCPSGKKLVDNRGVVLVDEIDLHIHPRWQRIMIPRIAKALPKLQFLFTTRFLYQLCFRTQKW